MISICALLYDYFGDVLIDAEPDTELQIYQRRNSLSATLDGLSTVADMGYTASDNMFSIKAKNLSEDQRNRLIHLVETYAIVLLSCDDGVFKGVLNNLRPRLDPVEFIFQVTEKLT